MDALELARKRINEVDAEMATLFRIRMEAAAEVAAYKREHGMAVEDKEREEEVLRVNSAKMEDDELRAYYVNFLRNNMKLSRDYQQKLLTGMRVAYCGTEGAFAHIATGKLFPTAGRIPYGDFTETYRAVENGDCDAAVLPVENSYNGEVGQVTDLMFSGSLFVNGMIDLAVSHDLLAPAGTKSEDIREVVSHPQALAQCAGYIRRHGWVTHEYPNTALAAKYAASAGNPHLAAIASAEAAEVFGLSVLDHNINESRSNTTRFAVFSRSENRHISGQMGAHFILVFTVRNEAGSLARAIDVIGRYGFNMRTLRSRPMKELLWQYYFYAEAEGNIHTPQGSEMMRELARSCDRLKLIGNYSHL